MSDGHRHHFFHHRDDDYESANPNSNYAYGSTAVQGPYVSSDYQTGYIDHYNAGNDYGQSDSLYGSGSDYNTGSGSNSNSDFQTGSGYNAGPDYKPVSAYNDGNDYRTGSTYNAINDYPTGSAYNTGNDYQKGYDAGKDYQKGYNAGSDYQKGYNVGGSDYQQNQSGDNYGRARQEEIHDKRMEHVGELGAMAAGGYALYEKHEVKADPEHARRHRIEEEVAAAGAVASGGYALHEHNQIKKLHGKEASGGRKHHRRFF